MDNKLNHAGIKGMKWGVRRYQNKDGSLTPAGKKRYNRDAVKDMSDEELRKKLNRLQMENQYKNLTQKKTSAGRKFVTNVLVTAATTVATAYATKYMKSGAEAAGKAIMNMVKGKN